MKRFGAIGAEVQCSVGWAPVWASLVKEMQKDAWRNVLEGRERRCTVCLRYCGNPQFLQNGRPLPPQKIFVFVSGATTGILAEQKKKKLVDVDACL